MQQEQQCQVLHIQRREDTWRLQITLQTKDLYGYVIKGMDDYQEFVFFQKVYTK